MAVTKAEITFFQSCTSVTFFLGVPTNTLVLIYLLFGSKDHCRITLNLFTFIVSTDLLFCITVSPFSIQQISGIQLYSPSNQVFCEIFEFFFNTLSRIIYFWMSLLAVVRARAIKNPLSLITTLTIRLLMAMTTIVFVVLSLVPLIIRRTSEDAFCGGRLEDTFKDKLVRTLWVGFGTLLPCALSVVVMVCANLVSLYCLLKVRNCGFGVNKDSLKKKRSAAKTTLILTTVFFCLHIIGVIKSWSKLLGVDIGVGGFYANGLMILSATIDPLVYLVKTPAVRTYWKRVFVTKQFTRLRRYSHKRFTPLANYTRYSDDFTVRTTVVMDTFRTVPESVPASPAVERSARAVTVSPELVSNQEDSNHN